MIGSVISAFASPILFGLVAKYFAGFWVEGPVKNVFVAGVGFAIGKYSYGGPPDAQAISQGLSSLVALFALWFVLLRPDRTGDGNRSL